jgi:hypothetical protein
MCKLNAPSNCLVGIPCPDNVPFNDALHTKNVFHDENGGELFLQSIATSTYFCISSRVILKDVLHLCHQSSATVG